MTAGNFNFKAIGVVHSRSKYRYEEPRQGVFSGSDGEIELYSPYAGDAITDLAGFERIWVIFCFHLNCGKPWKAKVRPPFPAGGPSRSVFATRSPHRANPIGMSCVELAGIEGNRLLLRHIDMLDGTPVLDVKPYIPEVDAFPHSAAGWRDQVPAAEELIWNLEYTPQFLHQAEFIRNLSGLDMVNFAGVQLANEPLDSSRKRVKPADNGTWILGCRTWRIRFTADSEKRRVVVDRIESNYTADELRPGAEDKYFDKEFHRRFLREAEQ
ncbi:MAG: tRNA (N6-threonylcarbamoyladenosine(37)-N6)-methyltransferase TrmO [Lentisphaerae bacterium]|nr:tRNA (N6-threonylcarbamoyladenosine(37)-N6)-methyltransferase TrmO [Lentisphaerota bacterium]